MVADLLSARGRVNPIKPIDSPPVFERFPDRNAAFGRVIRRRFAGFAAFVLVALLAVVSGACTVTNGQGGVDARIASAEPFTWDPALAGDAGTASVHAQVYEGLTTFDQDSNVQPALASSWTASDDGRQLTFQLRPGLRYSDGSEITAQHVVDSWLRLIDPVRPSPLASLLDDIEGAADYRAGAADRDAVGLVADANQVIVRLRRPATYFLAVTASPTLAVVPPQVIGQVEAAPPTVVSGAYVPSVTSPEVIALTGNANYWAGLPALDRIDLVTDFGGRSGVDVFASNEIDYTGIGAADASWIVYDASLGPQLRRTEGFSVSYYGFNTTSPPFDDPDVRLAFAQAVDWKRISSLAEGTSATSMVPPGIPGRDEEDHQPTFDPEAARQLLANAGFEGGENFPPVVIGTYGVGYESVVAQELEQNLGVEVTVEGYDFETYTEFLDEPGAPQIWTLSWSADYPHAHDFLGLLLETGSSSNAGNWSNAEYDALIDQAAATADPAEQAVIYAQAQDILEIEAPVVPVEYNESWALSRTGLLGALDSGVGFIRYAGMAWAPGSGR
jgi:ABC-type oligopeptide transport system substrate-binding subunit